MKVTIPDYFTGVFENTRNALGDMLSNPTLWSEAIIKETLTRTGSQAFNIEDVQHIVREYLIVLSEKVREGSDLGV